MARLPPRDLQAEVSKHFKGTPAERVRTARRLGEQMLEAFLATLPGRSTRAEARAILRRNKNRGRRRCRALEDPQP
jgi:hypothetical protein